MTPMNMADCTGEKPVRPQPYTKYCRQLRNAGSERGGLPQGRAAAHQMVVQCQTVSPENTQTGSIVWTEQVLFSIYIYISIYTYAYNNN